MRAVVQRVTNADVKIDGRVNGKIDDGLLVLRSQYTTDSENILKQDRDASPAMRNPAP